MKSIVQDETNKLHAVITEVSANKNGSLDVNAFAQVMKKMGHAYSSEEVAELFSCLDEDASGKVSRIEFGVWWQKQLLSASTAQNKETVVRFDKGNIGIKYFPLGDDKQFVAIKKFSFHSLAAEVPTGTLKPGMVLVKMSTAGDPQFGEESRSWDLLGWEQEEVFELLNHAEKDQSTRPLTLTFVNEVRSACALGTAAAQKTVT